MAETGCDALGLWTTGCIADARLALAIKSGAAGAIWTLDAVCAAGADRTK